MATEFLLSLARKSLIEKESFALINKVSPSLEQPVTGAVNVPAVSSSLQGTVAPLSAITIVIISVYLWFL